MGVACSTNGREEEYMYWWESEGKRPIGRPRCRWMDNMEMDFGEIEWDGIDSMVWLRIWTHCGLL
jgi:hypothetical protein